MTGDKALHFAEVDVDGTVVDFDTNLDVRSEFVIRPIGAGGNAPTLDISNQTMTFNSSSGAIFRANGGGFNGAGSTVLFDGGGAHRLLGSPPAFAGGNAFNNLVTDVKQDNLSAEVDTRVDGDLDIRGSLTVEELFEVTSTASNTSLILGGITVNGVFDYDQSGTAPKLDVGGNISVNSGGELIFDGGADAVINTTGSVDVAGSLTINNVSGTFRLSGSSDQGVSGGALSISNLEVDKPSGVFRVFTDLTVNGALDQIQGQLNVSSGDLLTVSGSADFQDAVVIASTAELNLQSGASFADDLSVFGTLTTNDQPFVFDGSNAQTISGGGTINGGFAGITVNNAGNTVTLQDFTYTVLSSGNLTMTAGNLDIDNASGAELILASDGEGTGGGAGGTANGPSAYVVGATDGTASITGTITMERFLENNDGSSDQSQLRMLSFPMNGTLDDGGPILDTRFDDELFSNVWTQGAANGKTLSGQANAWTFDESGTDDFATDDTLAAQWIPISDFGTTFDRGDGFMGFIFADDDYTGSSASPQFPKRLALRGTIPANEFDDSSPVVFSTGNNRLFYTSNGSTDADGWNLIGNPFLSPIDWQNGNISLTGDIEGNYYVYDQESGEYLSRTKGGGSSGTFGLAPRQIAPFQGFFVKLTGMTTPTDISIGAGAKTTTDAEIKNLPTDGPPVVYLGLTDASNGRTTQSVFGFTSNGLVERDRNDAMKLVSNLDGRERPLLASKIDGEDVMFEIQTLPYYSEGNVVVDVEAIAPSGGTFTFEPTNLENIPSDWSVTLRDNDTGQEIDLLAGQTMQVTLSGTKRASQTKQLSGNVPPNAPSILKAPNASGDGLSKASTTPRFQLIVENSPLPVELDGFTANLIDGTPTALLEWRTLSETNNDRFEIQQQVDGDWTKIGAVEGAGTTSEPQIYSFRVENLDLGEHTFRLRQVDVNGTDTFSEKRSVRRGLTEAFRLKTYPNPVNASSNATVAFAVQDEAPVTIEIYNTLGQRVQTLYDGMPDVTGEFQEVPVNVTRLASGMYFVRIRGEGFSGTEKLVVVR